MRLWVARHSPRRRLWLACLIVLILAIALAAGLIAARRGLVGTSGGPELSGDGAHGSRPAVIRGLAAGWVASQIADNVTLACDPAMCTALAARGFPTANLVSIAPGSAAFPHADLVVATQAVRARFGDRLSRVLAPLVIAGFGTGPAQIQIRQVAPHGAATFRRQFRNGQAALRWAAAELLKNTRIIVTPAARAALVAGRVDGRLLAVLAALAARRPIRVLGFTDTNPGAAPGVPMRAMLLAGSDAAAHLPAPVYARSLLRYLVGQPPPFHPARCSMVRRPGGLDAISVSFPAPSPTGV